MKEVYKSISKGLNEAIVFSKSTGIGRKIITKHRIVKDLNTEITTTKKVKMQPNLFNK